MRSIRLFMWAYQHAYRANLEYEIKNAFNQLGISDISPKVLLVGARSPNRSNEHPVCIEPENGAWPLSMLSGLLDNIETTFQEHPEQNTIYGDEASMRDKPENIRKNSVVRTVSDALLSYDTAQNVQSFCSGAVLVADYYVVPIIQVPNSLFKKFPPLNKDIHQKQRTNRGYLSLIHSTIYGVLAEANKELKHDDPGRFWFSRAKRPDETIREAARQFFHTPAAAVTDSLNYYDIFDKLNQVSASMYEGTKGTGYLLLSSPENQSLEYILRFHTPVPFAEPRWARKTLQMATESVALIADAEMIYGLGRISSDHDNSLQNVFTVAFLDHYHWELRCGQQVFLRSHYGDPKLPQPVVNQELFVTNYERMFPESRLDERNTVWEVFNAAIHQDSGSMIVVAEDAEQEAQRLSQQGTIVYPTLMTKELFERVSSIDGTIILDPHGVCHAIGVILDGWANPDCTPARGSRFNSGQRYVKNQKYRRLAIIVSEDKTVDIIPHLRPMVKYKEIEENIAALEKANINNYLKPRNWLDKYRFYLNENQCNRINITMDRLNTLLREDGALVLSVIEFKPDPFMDESYLLK